MKRDGYKFYISVVIPVYNTEAYLEETIESVIDQSIGFEENIQLILVNNASEDNSEEICKRYLEKYPDNVIYHKIEVNNGPCPARNAGMDLASGKYINFLDSDDKWEPGAFEKACSYFDEHYDETDLVSCRMRYFDASDDWHGLDWKYRPGSPEMVNILENHQSVQLHVGSVILKSETALRFRFDDRVRHAEDCKYVTEIILEKQKYALMPDVVYFYRTRSSGDSLIQNVRNSKSWYFDTPGLVYQYFFDLSRQKFGRVLPYLQYIVMYELQWRLKTPLSPELTQDEADKYRDSIKGLIKEIDDEVILEQKKLEYEYIAYALMVKHGISKADQVIDRRRLDTVLHFFRIDKETGSFTIEGSHLIMAGTEKADLTPVLLVDEQVVTCEVIDIPHHEVYALGEVIADHLGYKATVKIKDAPFKICPALMSGDGKTFKRISIRSGRFFPVSHVYENAYAEISCHMLKWQDGSLCLIPGVSRKALNAQERSFRSEVWKKDLLGGRKAVLGRMINRIQKKFKRKAIWIISDRIMRADDNGEALFLYLQENPVKNVKTVFAISRQSPDYKRLKRIGCVVDAMSFRHKLLHLLCDVNISSQADETTINPFANHDDGLRDLLTSQRFVFLQHGIIKDDLSSYLNRFEKNMTGFVTSAEREYESVLNGDYGYTSKEVWLTGLPRYDRLYKDNGKSIAVMPTWREYLMTGVDPNTGLWRVCQNIKESEFYRFYHGLLSSDRLISGLEQLGYSLVFLPHPVMRQSGLDFSADSRVEVIHEEKSYRELFAACSLLVSDYSSTVFDFAYLRKPVVYCQFDEETFFVKHLYSKGYFDYREDGLGEVVYDLEATIDIILRYARNGCQLEQRYKDRIDGFFAYNDKGNCKRVLDKILEST